MALMRQLLTDSTSVTDKGSPDPSAGNARPHKNTQASTLAKKSSRVLRKLASRQKDRVLDATLDDQFASGRLLACISSRPGQSGRADGYILEGGELAFYKKKLDVKKDKKH